MTDKTVRLLDRGVEISGTRETADGYLIADAVIARSGIYVYEAEELGLDGWAGPVRVYKPESSLTDEAAMRTLSHAPVTFGHPTKDVSPETWREVAVGETSTDMKWENGRLRVPLIIKDAKAIRAIKDGTRELSPGYMTLLRFEEGVTPGGEPYELIQQSIEFNHVAVVDYARGGHECRIGDRADQWGVSPIIQSKQEDNMPDALKSVALGDVAVQIAASDAASVEAFKAAEKKRFADQETAHKAALDAKDAELAKKDAEIKQLKDAALDDAALDKRVQERAALLDNARKLDPQIKTAGLSDGDIRKTALAKVLGDAAIADKDDAYVNAMFDIQVDQAKDSKTASKTVGGRAETPALLVDQNHKPAGTTTWDSIRAKRSGKKKDAA
ncbi:MAG: DUF2213 domain-containing protein [Pseudomonadota bacterium]